MDDFDDNIFDEDDALDYIMSEEVEKEAKKTEVNNTEGRSGCLGVVLLLIFPVLLVELLADWFI